MTKAKAIKLVSTCPHCGEAVHIVLTKKDVKTMWKGFKKNIRTANREGDAYLEAKVRSMKQ